MLNYYRNKLICYLLIFPYSCLILFNSATCKSFLLDSWCIYFYFNTNYYSKDSTFLLAKRNCYLFVRSYWFNKDISPFKISISYLNSSAVSLVKFSCLFILDSTRLIKCWSILTRFSSYTSYNFLRVILNSSLVCLSCWSRLLTYYLSSSFYCFNGSSR